MKGGTEGSAGLKLQMNFEAEEESILEMLIPKYMISMIYGGLLEAAASEKWRADAGDGFCNGQCWEMLEDLTVRVRARQERGSQAMRPKFSAVLRRSAQEHEKQGRQVYGRKNWKDHTGHRCRTGYSSFPGG